MALVRDSDVDVRARAIGALGELGDSRAVEAITGALKDADAGVRLRAVRALAELTDGGNGPRPAPTAAPGRAALAARRGVEPCVAHCSPAR